MFRTGTRLPSLGLRMFGAKGGVGTVDPKTTKG